MIERAGFWRRGAAALADLIVAQILLEGLVALLFAASDGRVSSAMALYTACNPVETAPIGVTLPPGFVATSQSLCRSSFFGAPTRTLYVARHEEKAGAVTTATSFSAATSPDGRRVIHALGLDALFGPLFILLRWASDRFAGGSLGRRLVRIAVTDAGGTASGAALPALLARRYARFAWPQAPGSLMLALGAAFEAASGHSSQLLVGLSWLTGSALLGVAQLAAAMAIFRHQDTFYDAPSGTAVATRLEIARARDMWPDERIAQGLGPIEDLRVALGAARRRVPWLSVGLVGVMAAVFLGEILLPVSPAGPPGVAVDTLMAWGGMDRELAILSLQPYRLLAAIFLHGNLTHLVLNAAALIVAGFLLERLLGPALFGLVFLLGGLAGSVASVTFNPPQLIAVGASGGILALFAAALAVSVRVPAGNARRWLQAWPIVVCIPAVLPVVAFPGGFAVDRADHAGGEVAGLLLGIAVAVAWRDGVIRRPSWRIGAAAAAGLAALVGVMVLIGGGLRAPIQAARLVPPGETPQDDEAWMRQAPILAARYPDDPRALLGLALREARNGTPGQAATDVDRAIAAQSRLSPATVGKFRLIAHSSLAAALYEAGDLEEAITQYSGTIAEQPLAAAFRQRALAELYTRRTAEAVSDLRHAVTIDPKEGYAVLWLAIASTRANTKDDVDAAARSVDFATWPGQIVRFFVGGIDADALMVQAFALDRGDDQHRVCEAKFYIGEWWMMRNRDDAARPLFRDAASTCPHGFIESRAASEELAGHGGLHAE